jgi:adenosine deaminase
LSELKQVVLNGFKSAFLPFHERRAMLRAIAGELNEFDSRASTIPNEPPGASDSPASLASA